MESAINDTAYYTMVVRPYKYWKYKRQMHTYAVRGLTYEDLLYQYYEYKEGIEDARAQADRWRHQ